MIDAKHMIGLELSQAKEWLLQQGIANYQVVLAVDRKQDKFDKEIVTCVRTKGETLQLIACRYLFEIE